MATDTELVLDIDGMTCASCVSRVEKSLNSIPGVTAVVNLVTNTAHVSRAQTVTTDEILDGVRRVGYGAAVAVASNEHKSDADSRMLAARLWTAVALTVPIVILAMVPAWQFVGWQWLSFGLATPVVLWCAWPIHRATWGAIRHGSVTMDTLITLGTVVAYLWSTYALFFGMAGVLGMQHGFEFFAWQQDPTANIYLETAAGVTTFILLGRWLEERSKRTAASALREVGKLSAVFATVMDSTGERQIAVSQLSIGDIVCVRPGESIPIDGTVLSGSGAVDNSALTGESIPEDVAPGDKVSAGTIAVDGRLEIRAERVHGDTRIAQLARLVEQAQLHKMSLQRLVDKISAVFVPIVLALAVATIVAWLALGFPWTNALTAAVAVLVIACPCALGLATPVALIVGTGRAAKMGIIFSGPDVVEQSARIDTLVLDKTGTVTTGMMSVSDIRVTLGEDSADVLGRAGLVERLSEHPIARAIVNASSHAGSLTTSSAKDIAPTVTDFRAVPGGGASAVVDGTLIAVGRVDWLTESGFALPTDLSDAIDAENSQGRAGVGVAWLGTVRGLIFVADTIRPDAREAIARLRDGGLEPMLVSGDARASAEAVAAVIGIDRVHAGVTPENKVAFVASLQQEGHRVAMVGDGINDAAALAQADIGLAMGSGTDLAIAASDMTLVRTTVSAAADAIYLARRTLRVIRGNLFWAFAYNVVMIPLAALGFLTPMLAGAAMAFSSVFVVLNSLRLRRVTLKA